MRNRNFIGAALVMTVLLLTGGCSKEISLDAQDPSWDRDVCHRCRMMLSNRHFSAQVVDPESGRHYFFDDLGCALGWLDEAKPQWSQKAVIYANAADSGKWTDVRRGVIAEPFVTPMSFGLGVFPEQSALPEGKHRVTLEQAFGIVRTIREKGRRE